MSKTILAILTAFGIAAVLPSANAGMITYTLTVNGCPSGCGSGPYGTVTLNELSPTMVSVTETLAANEIFANTNAGEALGYTLNATGTTTGSSLLPSGFAGGGSQTFSTLGVFGSTIICAPCGNGTNPPQYTGPVTFILTNASGLTLSNFVANSSGYFFAADIGVKDVNGMVTGSGNVGALGGQVPEPASLILSLSGGMLLIGGTLLTRLQKMSARKA